MGSQWKSINENYNKLEGYKRVAWPPASEERIIREFTPQPHAQSPAPGYAPHPSGDNHPPATAVPAQPQNYGMTQQQQQHQPQYNQVGPQQSYQPPNQQYQNQPNQYQNHSQQNPDPHYHQQQQQQPSQWNQHQQQQPPQYQAGYPVPAPSQVNTSFAPQSNYLNNPQTQYQQQPNFGPSSQNYSVPQNQQQQPISQDQTDQFPTQALPQEYRGGSPGIITLRKEAPVSQKPSPVYTSQPAATSYQGGNNLRGDLKWPPPEYKEAAARENEERRKLALGPVCRPRRVNRDYTSFFAQHALNSTYPSYKVPPGTQHMLA